MSINANDLTSRPGGLIRRRRIAAGLSQQRVAEDAGCSLSYVRLIEAGMTPTRSAVLPRIEAALLAHEDDHAADAALPNHAAQLTKSTNDDAPAANGRVGKERDAGAHQTD